jgi:hypothetical protein
VELLGKVRDRSVCTPKLLQNAAYSAYFPCASISGRLSDISGACQENDY